AGWPSESELTARVQSLASAAGVRGVRVTADPARRAVHEGALRSLGAAALPVVLAMSAEPPVAVDAPYPEAAWSAAFRACGLDVDHAVSAPCTGGTVGGDAEV